MRVALAFLTRLPGGRHPSDGGELARSAPWFPVVGLVVGALGAAAYAAMIGTVPALTAAVVAVGLTALATGAFHEDGLADTFDGLAGGRDPAHRLQIMDDSRLGTFGAMALIVVIGIKVSSLAQLDRGQAVATLLAAHTAGRAAAVALLAIAPSAGDGLGRTAAGGLSPIGAAAGGLVGVAALIGGMWWAGPLAVVVAAGAVIVAAGVIAVWARRRIGGVTGDVLGAAEQLAEAAILTVAAAVATS